MHCILPPQKSCHVNISTQLESDLSYKLVDWMGKAKCQDFLKKLCYETKLVFLSQHFRGTQLLTQRALLWAQHQALYMVTSDIFSQHLVFIAWFLAVLTPVSRWV